MTNKIASKHAHHGLATIIVSSLLFWTLVDCGAGGDGDDYGKGGHSGNGNNTGEGDGSYNLGDGSENHDEEGGVIEGGYGDSKPEVDPSGCSDDLPPEAKIPVGICAQRKSGNECDHLTDVNSALPNGDYGNGFDDNCDGRVDEGCACGPNYGEGSTKECYLMPASWVDPITKKPVGWCAQNSKGTMRCINISTSAEHQILVWDGECRGALHPFSEDVCAPGDYNCDGVPMNPGKNCRCVDNPVTCPLEPLKMNPFPTQTNLTVKDPKNPLIDPTVPFIVDGWNWIEPDYRTAAVDWQWELTGGDCDNIMPHPSFRMFRNKNASGQVGSQKSGLGPGGQQVGYQSNKDSTLHQVYPAFTLSGDYVLKAKFKIHNNDFECSVKIQVRAPGIRAELCWNNMGNCDIDLHVARMQSSTSTGSHGWFRTANDDCYYSNTTPDWGYANSHNKACHGWGAKDIDPIGLSPCKNPRLDQDNMSCVPENTLIADPVTGATYCSAENINIDNPRVGDKFLIGAHNYGCGGQTSYPHINLYCNGERKLSIGYQPPLNPGPHRPALVNSGVYSETYGRVMTGDLWTAALLRWTGNDLVPCEIETVPSRNPNPEKDGSSANCVDYGPQNAGYISASGPPVDWLFTAGGGFVDNVSQACWH